MLDALDPTINRNGWKLNLHYSWSIELSGTQQIELVSKCNAATDLFFFFLVFFCLNLDLSYSMIYLNTNLKDNLDSIMVTIVHDLPT